MAGIVSIFWLQVLSIVSNLKSWYRPCLPRARHSFVSALYLKMEDLATAAAAEEDKIVHEQNNTRAFLQDRCLGEGILTIRER